MSLVINHNMMATRTANALSAQYGQLATSTQRLSTGLRVNSAADDAAGLAIRELQRADISTLHQGARNANDAVSMIQTADGALAIIDEKLIRMKELAEQAATGTYDSTQRLMIASEFEQMASEIDRIANATDFNGIKLLDGSLSGQHDGTGLTSTGAMKIHFGTGNDSAEDYYYVTLGDATTKGLGLTDRKTVEITQTIEVPTGTKTVPYLSGKIQNGAPFSRHTSGIISFSIIPKGTRNLSLELNDLGLDDSLELFRTNGEQLIGTSYKATNKDWSEQNIRTIDDMNNRVLTEANAFDAGAAYSDAKLNGGQNLTYSKTPPYNVINIDGMRIGYSGNDHSADTHEYLTIDAVSEDLVLLVVGKGSFDLRGQWDHMPDPQTQQTTTTTVTATVEVDATLSISTQELAQKALNRINDAIIKKDNIRAHLGAMQNRLENTITNLNTQAENLQAAESRISDVDIATEMTTFVRNQILSQSATAMLAQANSLPQMAMQIIGG